MTSTSAISQATIPIQISDLTVKFGRTAALSGINLVLQPGSIFALIGPNGAGKTTLVNIATGVLRPSSGILLFRHAAMVDGGDDGTMSLDAAELLVESAIEECERFYPVFQFVLWGGKSPKEAIAAALIEATFGRAEA